MEAKGKEVVCQFFENENVRFIFGNPGSTEIPLLDNLTNHPNLKFVLGLHEGVVIAMADGYARASGSPGIAMVHATPGAAHALGGIFNAHEDDVPLIVITGQQDSRTIARESFVSDDVVAMTRQFTKWGWQVTRGEELLLALRRAFKEATAAPCGPVLLSIAKDVLDETVDVEMVAPEKYRVAQRLRGDAEAITTAAELLVEAEDPTIIVGRGVSRSGAIADLVKLAEVIGARVHAEPCSFPMDHPSYVGPYEMLRLPEITRDGDVIMVVGSKMFVEPAYYPTPLIRPGTKLIHLDASTREVGKNYPLDAAIVADPKVGLKELVHTIQGMLDTRHLDRIDQRRASIAESSRQRVESLRKALDEENPGDFVRAARLASDLREVLDEDAIIVDDAIRGATYLKRYFQFRLPGTYYGFPGGALGWGIGAAIGVKLARPNKQVVAFVGDGATMYYPQALWTAANENVPIVVIVLNNGGYMAIKAHTMAYNGDALKQRNFLGTNIAGVDYVKMAESFGVAGVRVQDESKVKSTLREAVNAGQPVLVEVVLDPKDTGFGKPRLP